MTQTDKIEDKATREQRGEMSTPVDEISASASAPSSSTSGVSSSSPVSVSIPPASSPLSSSTGVPVYSWGCPCCCPCDTCVAARAACTDPDCSVCTQPPDSASNDNSTDNTANTNSTEAYTQHHHKSNHTSSTSHDNTTNTQTVAATHSHSSNNNTPTLAAVAAVTLSSTAATQTQTTASSSPSHSLANSVQTAWVATATVSSANTVSPSYCDAACCRPSSGTSSTPSPMDDKLHTFAALLSRCLNNRAALQRMYDCGCLEHFITELGKASSTYTTDKTGKPQLTISTNSPTAASTKQVNNDWEDGKKKRRKSCVSSSSPSSVNASPSSTTTHASPPAKRKVASTQPAHDDKMSKKTRRGGTRDDELRDASSLSHSSCASPTSAGAALSSYPALVRCNTLPVNQSIMNSPASATSAVTRDSPQHVSSATVYSSPSASSTASSPRRTPVKARARKSPVVDPKHNNIKGGRMQQTVYGSAPNTPTGTRLFDNHNTVHSHPLPPLLMQYPQNGSTASISLSEHLRVPASLAHVSTPASLTSRSNSPSLQEPYSPTSQRSTASYSDSSLSSPYSVSVDSTLSPVLQFTVNHGAGLHSMSLPSSHPDVSLHMDEMDTHTDYPGNLRSASRASPTMKIKAELLDDYPHSYNRPRALSESHSAHPSHHQLHGSGDEQTETERNGTHDFLVNDQAATSMLQLDDDEHDAAYTSGGDSSSLESEQSSPIPKLENSTTNNNVNTHHPSSTHTAAPTANTTDSHASTNPALNGLHEHSWSTLDLVDLPLSLELTNMA